MSLHHANKINISKYLKNAVNEITVNDTEASIPFCPICREGTRKWVIVLVLRTLFEPLLDV